VFSFVCKSPLSNHLWIDELVGSFNHLAFAGLCANEGLLGWIAIYMVSNVLYDFHGVTGFL